jgi:hypothetical protein
MHRTGTSLVAGMLTQLGLYLDPRMPPPAEGETLAPANALARTSGYGEALAFHRANVRLLRRAGADWSYPEPFLASRDSVVSARLGIAYLQLATATSLRSQYLAAIPRHAAGWGFKDPRTSLALPYWLALFPEARVIHVRRDALSVAASLLRRAHEWPERTPTLRSRFSYGILHPVLAARFAVRKLGQAADVPRRPPLDQQRCLDLHAIYVAECEGQRCMARSYLDIEFAELVRDPIGSAHRLAAFVPGRCDEARQAQAAAYVLADAP